MSKGWKGGSTRAWRKLRSFVLQRDGYRCQLKLAGCTGTATEAHHLDGVKAGLVCPPSRLQASCKSCNNAVEQPTQSDQSSEFSLPSVAGTSRPLSRTHIQEAPERLRWSPGALGEVPWLRDLLDVPESAAPPFAMTPPHPEAVGSYGAEHVEWVREELGIEMRWWQRLAAARQLEHREDGSLCWRTIVESGPRRIGKSVRLRSMALWRLDHADLFGERQLALHTGKDVAIVREIHRQAWAWATMREDWALSRGVGQEEVRKGIHRWLVRSVESVYGYDVTLGMIDEAWAVAPGTFHEGLEPATLERHSPQLLLTSTANRKATSLMRSKLSAALAVDDGETLLLLWAAPAGADPADPAVWRAASAHWSPDRAQMVAAKYKAAAAGEVDPQADDPDPMSAFTGQYLNVWQLDTVAQQRGEEIITADEWAELAADRPAGVPQGAAVESWFGEGVSLALAWRIGGQVVVSVQDLPDLAAAAAALKASGFRRAATIGASLLEDPALRGVRARKGQGRASDAVKEAQRLLSEDVLLHDGGEHLTGQILAVRTLPGADGPRMVSNGRADAVKAAVWAVADCRRKPVGRPRIVVAA